MVGITNFAVSSIVYLVRVLDEHQIWIRLDRGSATFIGECFKSYIAELVARDLNMPVEFRTVNRLVPKIAFQYSRAVPGT